MSMIERKSKNVKLTFGDMLYTIIRFKRYCMNWKDKLDPKLTKICTYIIGTVTALYLLYKLSDRFFVLLGSLVNFITYILGLLTPVFWGFFLAYLLLPLTDKIQEILANASWNKKDKNYRSAAVVITIILFCVGIVIFLSVLISTFTSQVQIADMESTTVFLRQIIDNLTGFITSITKELNKLNINSIQIEDAVQNAMNWLTSWGTNLGQGFLSSLEDIPNVLSQCLLIVIFAIWFLLDGANIALYWGKVMYVLFPDTIRSRISGFLEDADQVFSGYIRGQVIDAVIMMVLISVLLSICKVNFALAIGVLAGFGNLIPYVGPFIAYTLVTVVCVINGEWMKLLLSLVLLWIVQTIDGNIINPKLLGKHVNIHPMYVMIVLIFGSALGGLMGMLFAVPVGALIKLQFDRLLKKRIQQKQSNFK